MSFEGIRNFLRRKSPETVTEAAIEYTNGTRVEIFTGRNHQEAIEKLERKYPEWAAEQYDVYVDGFVTSSGRFVSRDEAGRIARKGEQLNHLPDEHKRGAETELHSNNINIRDK